MRNLKRVLSLALATAMLFSMMVIGASAANKTAADLTDMDKVTNKEAVSLMVDLGIIVGKPDGSFAPTETIDRATMSKLIYFIQMGNTDESAFKGVPTPLTDVKGNWAEGFINYCYSMKIVAGTGNNTYNPNGKVTVVSAAKMLLVALGYDAKLSKYENDAMWSINIMRDAQTSGLLSNVSQKSSDELTRDNAAQMIYNALMARTVTPIVDRDMGVAYLSKNEFNTTTLGYETYGLVKVTAKVTSVTNGKADLTGVLPAAIAAADVTGKIAASSSSVGQSVTFYVKVTNGAFAANGDLTSANFKSIYTSEIRGTNSRLLGSATGKALAKLTNKNEKSTYIAALETLLADVSFYHNGAPIAKKANTNVTTVGEIYYNTNVGEVLKAAGLTADAADAPVVAAGVIVELYDNSNNGKADVVRVTVKEVKKVSGDVKTKTDSDGAITVYVPGAVGTSSSYVSAEGYQGLKKDDIVLIYANSGVTYIEKATTVVGEVTGYNSDFKVRVNGTYYGKTGLTGATTVGTIGTSAWTDFDNEYTFYLDNGNNVVSYKKNTDVASSAHALVLESKFIEGGTIGASDYMQARILFSDASVQIVTVSKVGGKTVVKNGTALADPTKVDYDDVAATPATGFFTYVVDKNGKYELTVAADGTTLTNHTFSSATAIKNTVKFLNDGTTYLADNETVFVVAKGTGSDITYTSYTGYSKVPNMTAASGVVLFKGTTTGIAKYVYLTTTAFAGDVDEGSIFVVNPSKNEYDAATKTYTYKTIGIDGSEDTIKVSAPSVITTALGGATLAHQGLIKITAQDADGVVTAVAAVTPGALTTLSGGVLNNGTVYSYNSSTVFYTIDVAADKGVAASEGNNVDLADTDYTYAASVIAKDGVAVTVYIIRTVV